MNRAFTLLELIFVIIIVGILGSISMDILIKMYKNYVYTKEMEHLSEKLENALDIISAKLQNRVKNTLIVDKCSLDNDKCFSGDIENFKSLQVLREDEAQYYKVLEWIGKDVYGYRGMWNGKKIKPGWSSFIDLKAATGDSGNFRVKSLDSNFSYVQIIDGNWTKRWGIDGYEDVFENNLTVFIFSGSDGRGELTDMNHSYGYWSNLVGSNNKQVIYHVFNENISTDATEFNISVLTKNDGYYYDVYEVYYLVNSAFAIVPKENSKGYVDLYLFQNYYPWKDQTFVDGNYSLLIDDVSYFKYREDNGVVRLYMCVSSTALKDYNTTLCKERVVF